MSQGRTALVTGGTGFFGDLLKRRLLGDSFHCNDILAHAAKDKRALWPSNVEGARNLAEAVRPSTPTARLPA